VRRWHSIEIALEFRGFVGPNGHLNALSQYFFDCYFPEYGADPRAVRLLELSMLLCAESIHSSLADLYPGGYVVDFAVDLPLCELTAQVERFVSDPLHRLPVLVIELNPFDESTDDALFSWRLNKRTLLEGPLTTRVVTEPRYTRRSSWWTTLLQTFRRTRTTEQA